MTDVVQECDDKHEGGRLTKEIPDDPLERAAHNLGVWRKVSGSMDETKVWNQGPNNADELSFVSVQSS